ncbi:MAG: M28 family peptidase [candidate division WOR-3 bacterium]|nr:M28 family peptidase [candidate division WOR-3 bacterium]
MEFSKFGCRAIGTDGHRNALKYIIKNLKNPEIDSFTVDGIWLYNIYQKFPSGEPLIGIGAHWDSDRNCPGVNDGGSGVALLLKLADTLTKNPSDASIHLLFFDGEDVERAELYGSTHFASKCLDRYSFIIIIDMVGDKNLQIYKEGHSTKFFPALTDSIWQIGMEIAPHIFIPVVKYYIIDDHIPLIKYGLRAINIIDFDYQYWDTVFDTLDKCSKESLDIMYKFLLKIVYREY